MTIYRILLAHGGQKPLEYMISAVPLIVGRSARADIVLSEDSISRRHARFNVFDDVLYVEDLGSSNGVHVNGKRVQKAALSEADTILIGPYSFRVERLDDLGLQKLIRRTEIEHSEVAPLHEKLVVADQSSVAFLYRISQCMTLHRTIEPLLAQVVEAVMGSIPADRVSILYRRGQDDALTVAASQSRPGRGSEAPMSTTLIGHVVQTRASVLTTDAAQDDRFECSESIAQHQIKAVICAPLTGQEGVYGVLYAESDAVPVPLTQHHLQLLSVAGQIVGAGVENILLVERQIRQERLAGIGETVSGTSHDMRNIMMGISGGAAFIEMACDQGNWDQARNGVNIVRKSLTRFENLVNSLLTYARQTELEIEEADLGALVNEAATAASMEAEKRGIRLRIDNRAPGRIAMDPHQIYRVAMNLLANAMDATEGEGGDIVIETGRDEGAAYFRVRDTGCGMPPEDLAKLGQPFFTTKHKTGTGLGLAVSYRIMEQHRGRVLVDSAPGRGTVFTMLFPPDQAVTQHDNVSA